MALRAANLLDFPNKFVQVETDDLRKRDQFDKIDPALTILDVGYERLVAAQGACDSSLRQPGLLSPLGNQFRQPLVTVRM